VAKLRLFLNAYGLLLYFDSCLARRNFRAIHERVRGYTLKRPVERMSLDTAEVCHAIDSACVWYRKEVLCLQRSAATACLLRSRGIPGRLVIGTHPIPFRAHAWVEVDGRVVNDKPGIRDEYTVLEEC
jgi:hypothetical protein